MGAARHGVLRLLLASTLPLALAACSSDGNDAQGPLPSGYISTWAGTGRQGNNGDGKLPAETQLNEPMELAFDSADRAFIVDWNNHALRATDSAGKVVTLIGQPFPGDWPCQDPMDTTNCEVPLSGRVPAGDLYLNHPMDIVPLDDGSFIYAAWHNHKVERCDQPENAVSVIAGQQAPGFVGDEAAASSARLNFPDSIVIDAAGGLLVSDERNQRVRRIDTDGTIRTVVGGVAMGPGYAGDGGPALQAQLAMAPYNEAGGSDNPPPGGGLALDASGNLFLADSANHCIREVLAGADGVLGQGDPSEEIISTVAGACGPGQSGFSGDGGAATDARLSHPHDVEIGPDGALYIADTDNNAVRRVDLGSGTITTVAGTGVRGFSGDGGPATAAQLRQPYGIAFDHVGDLYIVDSMNNRIRRVTQ